MKDVGGSGRVRWSWASLPKAKMLFWTRFSLP
jgi:hypothetical protein